MTLTRRGLDDIKNQFGLVIIDECHHVPANTFSDVVKQFSAKCVLGLTATAYRKDKLEKLMHFYVSDNIISVAQQAKENQQDEESPSVETQLVTRKTSFTIANKTDEFQELGKFLIADAKRNDQIASDIAEILSTGVKCIVLTERIEHCETLLILVREKAKNIHAAIATGNMTKKNRERIAKRMMQERFQLLIATGKLIGEGFDWPAVSHVFFAFPFSWKGRLIQYVGRVQRPFEGKTTAVVHDYFDDQVLMLKLMYFKRLRTYRTLGLTKITTPETKRKQIDENQQSLFSI
jgi:superfamily II DNA or RNA helicase